LSGSRAGLNSSVMPSLRLGEVAGEFSDVPGADQLTHSGVITWRHCPVIAGRLAAPDPPSRVLAPEPVKFGIQGPPAWPGVHGRGRPAVDTVSAPRSPGMTSPARGSERLGRDDRSAMQLPPSSRTWDSGEPRVRRTGCRRLAAAPASPVTPPWQPGRLAAEADQAQRPDPRKAGRVPACTTAPGMTGVRLGAKSRGPARGVGRAPRGKKPLPG